MPEKFKILTIEELINGTYIPPMSDEEIIRRARLEKASENN